MVFVQLDCPICGRKVTFICDHCREDYLGQLTEPQKMTPLQRYLEVLFYSIMPEVLLHSGDVEERIEKLIGRSLRGSQVSDSELLANLMGRNYSAIKQWQNDLESLPDRLDVNGWHQYAREAYQAYASSPV